MKLMKIEDAKYLRIRKDKELARIYHSGIHSAALGIGFLGKGVWRNKLYETLCEI